MSKAIYKTSREVVLAISIMIMMYFIMDEKIIRGVSVAFMGGWYLLISHRYQKIYTILTPGYLYVTLNMMIVYIFFAALITEEQITDLNATEVYGWWTNDYYWLYFSCVVLVFIYITLHTKMQKKIEYDWNNIRNVEFNELLAGMGILFIVYVASGFYNDFIYPVVVFAIIQCICFKKYGYILILAIIFIMDEGKILLTRYNLIQVILPVILIITYKTNNAMITFKKRYLFLTVFIMMVLVYGTVSEIIKLNGHGMDYSIIAILGSVDSTINFFMRQVYRVFAIWIKLGGYVIYHVDNNGYFYGLSFIKGMADFFNVEYVSIPELAAIYDKATYAQTGSLVEGYANWGMAGAVAYMIVIVMFMDKMMSMFMEDNTVENLMCLTVPFTKILLDGGSLYSAVMIWACCKVLFVWCNIRRFLAKKEGKVSSD